MESIFLKILNMSITATWLAIAVIVLRLLLKNAPKFLTVILWGFVAVRLCFPFSIESVFSLIPSAEPIPESIFFSQAPEVQSSVPAIDNAVNIFLSGPLATTPEESVNPMQVVLFVASVVWAVGIVAMLGYTLFSFLQIRKKVRESVRLKENIWICDSIDTPFILGILDPQIYLPSAMDERDMAYVIAHEQAHLKRRDHLWKPFGFLLLSVHWFNPVLWIAYVLLCRDIESACDEKVIQENGTGIKIAYSEALINCSVPRKNISACPLAFGEVAVKERVKGVLNYKKPAFWIIFVALISLIITAVCLLTNPKEKIDPQGPEDNKLNMNATIPPGTEHSEKKIVSIVDKTESGEIATASAIELFYKDDTYTYSFSSIKSDYVIVTFDDGTEKTVEEALEAGEITIADLDAYDIGYIKEVIPTPGDPFHNIIDKATFDIDKDGKAEDCYLGHGPTSGLLTYKIYVSENGIGEYFDIFNCGPYLRKFIVSDGEWKIQGIDTGENPETHLFDIFIRDNNVVLSEDGKELEYWGEHDIDSNAVAWKWPEIEEYDSPYPFEISIDGKTIEPYFHLAFSGVWDGENFVYADGTNWASELAAHVKPGSFPITTITADSKLDITLAPNTLLQYFLVLDTHFNPLETVYDIDLSNLQAGEYWVGLLVNQQGEYIEQANEFEYTGWIGAFRLNME